MLLHHVASNQITAPTQAAQVGQFAAMQIYKTSATIGQYLLRIIFLIGAAGSAWRRSVRRQLVSEISQSTSAQALDGITWQEFELLVGEAFRPQGFAVTETGGGGADGCVDLALTKGGELFLVQCKQWKAFKVGVGVVRELYGVMAAKGAAGGYVVTSGRFTEEVKNLLSDEI
ncbi:MAG: restriction endonuclease [Pseudomonadota bacterium]